MNIKENLIAKWGIVAKISKKMGKKAIKAGLCLGLIVGGTGAATINHYVNNSGITAKAATSTEGTFYFTQNGVAVSDTIASNTNDLYYYLVKITPNSSCSQLTLSTVEYGKVTDAVDTKTFTQKYGECVTGNVVVITDDGGGYLDSEFSYGGKPSTSNVGDAVYFWNGVSDLRTVIDYVIDYGGYTNTKFIVPDVYDGTVKITKLFEDSKAPVISGYEGVYYTNVDARKPLSEIVSKIAAVDETDGAVAVNITEDNYTSNIGKLGTYKVKLSASDAAGNTSNITINIVITDGTKPAINGITTYTSNMSNPVTEATIRSKLSVTDNYDSNLSVTLVNDGFTGNERKAGSFTITYQATDKSGNVSAIHTVTITNYDDIAPVITGEKNLSVASTGIITSDYIINNHLTVTDNISTGLKAVLVEDNYTDNHTKVGTYTMTFKATDANGNVSETFTVNITVVDDIPPVFWVSLDFFSVEDSLQLTHEQIVAVLLAQNEIDSTQVVAYKVVEDDYTANALSVGKYAVSYQLQLASGEVMTLSTNINVIGEETVDNEVIENTEEEKGTLEKVGDALKKAWNWVKEHATYFYVGLGTLVVGLAVALGFRKKDNYGKNRRRK